MRLRITIDTYDADTEHYEPVSLVVDYHPGRPGVHTLSNGDPGYPDEPAEFDIIEAPEGFDEDRWMDEIIMECQQYVDAQATYYYEED